MEYNLVRNAQLSYLINNNGHNRILSVDEASYINDNDISFENSILVSGTEYLIFEAKFNRRIKIDKVKLYLYSTTTSGITLDHLNFYYSNDNELDYEIITDKFAGDNNFYYVELPFPSAPMKVKVTVSGLDCSISEYFISNDDYPIGFGKNGDLSKLYINRTDDNSRAETQQLAIYNRNTNSLNDLVSAYVCIDYTGEIGDNYLRISDKSDSGFIGVDGSIFIEDNDVSNTYIWDMGRFNDVKISNNELILDLDELTYMKGDIPHPDTPDPFSTYGNYIFAEDESKRISYITLSDYYLKLYEYSYIDDTWDFIGKINPGCTGWESDHSICRIDNYIYVLINKQCEFGRYDLNGEENNWEVLGTPPSHTSINLGDKFSICSDKEEYIYFISYIASSSGPRINENANFARYSTISGSVAGWESLSNGYEHGLCNILSPYTKCVLHYDIDDDCLYFMNGLSTDINYILRYDVNTNIWDNVWFELDHYITSTYNISFYYKDGLIYIINNEYIYIYDVKYYNFSILVKYIDSISYTSYNGSILIVNSLVLNNDPQVIIIGVGATETDYRDNVYWYNGISAKGDYITPILDIVDSYKSSYFLIDYELQQNTSVTNAKFEDMNIMELKSSDIPLLSIERIYLTYSNQISSINLYTDSLTDIVPIIIPIHAITPDLFAYDINDKTGDMCVSFLDSTINCIIMYDYNGIKKVAIYDAGGAQYNIKLTTIKFDSEGGIYGYNNEELSFTHFDSSLNIIMKQFADEEEIAMQKYIKEFCAGNDLSAWYIHEGYDQLIHCDMNFNKLYTIVLNTPYSLEPDNEGGVWVVYNDQMGIIKYNESHSIELTLSVNEPINKISSDKDGGLWIIQSLFLKYISKEGTIVKSFMLSNSVTWISAGYKSCFLYNNILKIGYFFRYPDGLIKEVTFDETQFFPPLFFCHNYEDELISKKNYLPVDYDPNWGIDGTIEWKDIQLNGYYLSKNKYHQLKITLRTSNINYTPKIKKIKLAPCIKLVDIQKDTYKSIYLKLDVPDQFKNQTYDAKIKCWWEDKE